MNKQTVSALLCFLAFNISLHPGSRVFAAEGGEAAQRQLAFSPIQIDKNPYQASSINRYAMIQSYLKGKQWDALEAVGKKAFSNKVPYAGGGLEIDGFFLSVVHDPAGRGRATDLGSKDYLQLIDSVQAWIAAKPSSAMARIALAYVLMQYAWKARGNGFANTVSEEAFALMHDREQKALRILYDAHSIKESYPFFWYVELNLLKDASKKAGMYSAFKQSQIEYPGYFGAYEAMLAALQPRWLGLPGEWEQFAKNEADKIGGPQGDKLYARQIRFVQDIGWYDFKENIFESFDIDWPRVNEGYKVLLKEYPSRDVWVLGEQAKSAVMAKDYATAKKAFADLHGRVSLSVWESTDNFELALRKAFAH